MTQNPIETLTFSIIIPTYNCQDYIVYALESALAQPGNDYEIIVIDDGSTDNTRSIISSFQNREKHTDRIHYYYQENKGVAAARNFGINHAKGQYILLLDADDRLLPTALKTFRTHLQQNNFPAYIIAGYQTIIGKHKSKITSPGITSNHNRINFKNYLRKKLKFCIGSILINRNIFHELNFVESLRKNDDIVIFLQILLLSPFIIINDPVVAIFKRDNSLRNTLIMSKNQNPIEITRHIFEHPVFPKELLPMRNEVLSWMFLSYFRELYKATYFKEAKEAYYQALRAYPLTIIKWPYLKKFLKLYLK